MKIVGLTGGIGSGKSTVARFFSEAGIPVYVSDDEAKNLMNEDPALKEKLINLFGQETYLHGIYNKSYVSSIVFKDKALLHQLNEIVHPAVFRHFDEWVKAQDAPFVVKEAAILFESGSFRDCDYIITVSASVENRTERVMKRDGLTAEEIHKRMENQWTDEQRIRLSNYVIFNDSNLEALRIEFHRVYKSLLNEIQTS
ncbi:MAG: dephospho-CoA kinase [Weeksellaceae bacterium]